MEWHTVHQDRFGLISEAISGTPPVPFSSLKRTSPFNLLLGPVQGTTTRLDLCSCILWSSYFWSLSYFCGRHCLFRKDLGYIWVIVGLFECGSEHIDQRDCCSPGRSSRWAYSAHQWMLFWGWVLRIVQICSCQPQNTACDEETIDFFVVDRGRCCAQHNSYFTFFFCSSASQSAHSSLWHAPFIRINVIVAAWILCGYYKFINRTCTLWLCLSCVRKTSDNTENLMFGLIAGQP
jgi:hypothetical protein